MCVTQQQSRKSKNTHTQVICTTEQVVMTFHRKNGGMKRTREREREREKEKERRRERERE